MSERLLPSEVKAKRSRLQGRVRISKRDLTELAVALREFEALSPADQDWVRGQIEAHDAGLSQTYACTHGIVPEKACALCRHRYAP